MPRRSFKSELETLIFALRANIRIASSPQTRGILNDFHDALRYNKLRERKRKFLIWGLLVGRSVDYFTKFFLVEKSIISPRSRMIFIRKIDRICGTGTCNRIRAITTNPLLVSELHIVRELRNDLFHIPGRHLNVTEMEDFIFKSVKCIHQLSTEL